VRALLAFAKLGVNNSGGMLCVLEQFDDISRWIFKQDLATSTPSCDFTPKGRARDPEFPDQAFKITCDDHESAPAARRWISSRLACTTRSRDVEKQMQVSQC